MSVYTSPKENTLEDLKSTLEDLKTTHSAFDGERYDCDQCDYNKIKQCNLIKHKQSNHGTISYFCDQCDYQATMQGSLTKHI